MTILVVQLKQMFMLESPTISSFTLPLSEQERNEQGKMNFAEEEFFLGVYPMINKQVREIPPEVGSLRAYSWVVGKKRRQLELFDCANFITQKQLKSTNISYIRQTIESGLTKCIDPAEYNVDDYRDLSVPINSQNRVLMEFSVCSEKYEKYESDVECLTDDELEKWFQENFLQFQYINSQMKVNLEARTEHEKF